MSILSQTTITILSNLFIYPNTESLRIDFASFGCQGEKLCIRSYLDMCKIKYIFAESYHYYKCNSVQVPIRTPSIPNNWFLCTGNTFKISISVEYHISKYHHLTAKKRNKTNWGLTLNTVLTHIIQSFLSHL